MIILFIKMLMKKKKDLNIQNKIYLWRVSMGNDTFFNYLMLAQAILFSDIDNGKDKVLCVYDIEENNRLVGVFNTRLSCSTFFGMSIQNIDRAICGDINIKGRFSVEYCECGSTQSELEYYKCINSECMERKLANIYKRKWGKIYG